LRRRRSGWPGTVPAIAAGTGVLFADADGGGAIFGRPSVSGAGAVVGTGEPGPAARFGFGWPG